MGTEALQEIIAQKAASIEERLRPFLPVEEGYQRLLFEAMNYSFLAGGKRLRPMFMEEVNGLFGGKEEEILPFMAAIEMIHTYSLVHDDLPAMDNDAYRRGKLTTWKAYGEDIGILAGDGLLNYAFETVLCSNTSASPERVLRALGILACKAGAYGMIGGQTADVLGEKKSEMTQEELLFIHENKTAALLEASFMVGAVMAGAGEEEVSALEQSASKLGLAFQIQDDILDVTGTLEELGKPIGSDAENGKQTYVTMHGLEQSVKKVEQLTDEAIGLLEDLPGDKTFLYDLMRSLVHRTK